VTEEVKTQLAKANDVGVLANVDFGDMAGVGFEGQTSRDMAIPFLALLQALSPQVTDGDPKRVVGAAVGDIYDTVNNRVLGRTVYFVPCISENVFVEWTPRDKGGGFVAVHALNDPIVIAAKAKAKDIKSVVTESGNQLVDTFYLYGLLIDSANATKSSIPVVIAFTSSKIRIYRRLMTALRTMKGHFPMCAFRLAVTSVDDKNKKNQPFKNFKIEPVNGSLAESVNLPGSEFEGLLAEGKNIADAVKAGVARGAYETQTPDHKDDGDIPF